jgi:hypothetical protein
LLTQPHPRRTPAAPQPHPRRTPAAPPPHPRRTAAASCYSRLSDVKRVP